MPLRRENQMSIEDLATILTQQMTAAIPNIIAQCNQALNNNNAPCNFKTLNSAKPSKLSRSQIRKGKLSRKGGKKSVKESKPNGEQTESSKKQKKRKAPQNSIVIAPNQAKPSQAAAPPAKKPYSGSAPLCNQCNFHHCARDKCQKCFICGLGSHLTRDCRSLAKINRASQNFAVIALYDQVIPNQPVQPLARKPYNGTAPLCDQCSLHHHASVKCRKCQTCGLIGHTARVCPAVAASNQGGNNPTQGRFSLGSCFNCGEKGHFQRNCPKPADAKPAQE